MTLVMKEWYIMKTRSERFVGQLSLILVVASLVGANYELTITVHSFTMLRNRCALCHQGNVTEMDQCCDYDATPPPEALSDGSCAPQCDVFFSAYCVGRPLGTDRDDLTTCPIPVEKSSNIGLIDASGTTTFGSQSQVLGVDNPFTVHQPRRWEGEEFLMNITDIDMIAEHGVLPNDFIDTLAIDIDIPVGASISRTTYTGRFNNTQVELSFRVVCAENYTGPDCTQLCENSSCPCDPGFTGEFCQIDINDCEGVNCSGNGLCVDGIESFVCQCDQSFTGELCDMQINLCDGVNCSGHGICVESSFSCRCNSGFAGRLCEITTCKVDCGQNGQCADTFSCLCDPGYTGDSCETLVSASCERVNCSGSGECIHNTSFSFCQCNPGFTGANCETTVDPCEGRDCGPNGQCVVEFDSYICECDSGFTGADCEMTIDNCTAINCEGGSPSRFNTAPIIIAVTLTVVILVSVLAVVILLYNRKKNGFYRQNLTQQANGARQQDSQPTGSARGRDGVYGNTNIQPNENRQQNMQPTGNADGLYGNTIQPIENHANGASLRQQDSEPSGSACGRAHNYFDGHYGNINIQPNENRTNGARQQNIQPTGGRANVNDDGCYGTVRQNMAQGNGTGQQDTHQRQPINVLDHSATSQRAAMRRNRLNERKNISTAMVREHEPVNECNLRQNRSVRFELGTCELRHEYVHVDSSTSTHHYDTVV